MNDFTLSVILWLADFLLLSTALLLLILVTLKLLAQPAQRLAVTKGAFGALAVLALLCATPAWSLIHLLAAQQPPATAPPGPMLTSDSTDDVRDSPPLPPAALTKTPHELPLASSATPQQPAFWPTITWPMLIASAYTTGSAGALIWLLIGRLAARRLISSAQPAPTALTSLLAELSGNQRHNVRLLVSPKIDVAVAIGLRHPAILLPRTLLAEIAATTQNELANDATGELDEANRSLRTSSHAALRSILVHELVHMANRDLHWLAVSRALLILLWPQPLFWLVRRRMRLDQEALADAGASEVAGRESYAAQLVNWARQIPPRRAVRLSNAVGLWESRSQLRQRIALLIDERFVVLRNCSARWRWSAISLSFVAALALSAVTIEPANLAEGQEPDAIAAGPAAPAVAPPAAATDPAPFPPRVPNAIVGRVTDEHEQPIAGANISLFRRRGQSDLRERVSQTTSDAQGNYRFSDVLDIDREFPGKKFPPSELGGGDVLTRIAQFPGRATTSSSSQLQAVAQFGEAEILKMPPAATLRGRVTSPDGKPVANSVVWVAPSSLAREDDARQARTDADGNYVIDDAAPFDLVKFRDEQLEQQRQAQQDAAAGRDTLFVNVYFSPPMVTVEHPDFATTRVTFEKIPGTKDIQLQSPAVLEGRVVFADSGKPAANVPVFAVTSHPKGDNTPIFGREDYQRANVRTDSDGRFKITTLPAGAYDVWAEHPDWINVGVQRQAAVAEKTTTVPELGLSAGGMVAVRLVDATTRQPVDLPAGARAQFILLPKSTVTSRSPRPQTVAANDDGRFLVRALPGRSQILITAVYTENRIQLAGMPSGQNVTIADGQTLEVDVPVIELNQDQATDGAAMLDVPAADTNLTDPNTARSATGTYIDPLPRPLWDSPPGKKLVFVDTGESKLGLPFDAAIESLNRELKARPDNVFNLLSRSEVHQLLGNHKGAIADLERVIQLNPDGPTRFVAHNNLAYLYCAGPDAALRDGKRAVELAQQAIKLAEASTPEAFPDLYDTLAAAFAETGDFEKAIETQERAIQLTPDNKNFREHLALYRQKQPLRQAANEKTSAASVVQPTELAGRVVDKNGNPLAGVEVDVWTWHPGNETVTNADGRFSLMGFDEGEHVEVEFTKDGLCPALFADRKVGQANWTIALNSDTFLEGVVRDESGRPVPHTRVRAARGPISNPQVVIGQVWTETNADAEGRYRLYLQPATYDLQVRKPDVGIARLQITRLASGDQRQVDIELDKGPLFSARVVDAETNEPVAGIRLWNWQPQFAGLEGTSDADGVVEIENFPAGPFEFVVGFAGDETKTGVAGPFARWWSPDAANELQQKAENDNSGFQRNFDDLTFNVIDGAGPFTIYVERAATVRGRVVDPDGNPVAGATVAPAKTGTGNSLTGDTRFSVTTDDEGRFEARLPASGKSKYNLVAHDGKFQEWRRWANGIGEVLQTQPGDELDDVTLQLTRPCVVRGKVLDTSGQPIANHRVRTEPVDMLENRYYDPETRTNAAGEFELQFVRPGEQFVQADPFWLLATDAPSAASQRVTASPDQPVEGVILRTTRN